MPADCLLRPGEVLATSTSHPSGSMSSLEQVSGFLVKTALLESSTPDMTALAMKEPAQQTRSQRLQQLGRRQHDITIILLIEKQYF